MQMTLRARFFDVLPFVLAFAAVSLFGALVVMEYVVRQQVGVPPAHSTAADTRTDAMSVAAD